MTLRRALPLLSSLLLAAGLLVGWSLPAQADDPLISIRINEVESNGDARDWIELTNIGATPTDVSGFVLMDNQSRTLTVPAGTSIAPGGFLAVDVDDPAVSGNFGLGGADQARVFLPDGTTLVDSYSWGTHAAVSYGRCPDGSGPFADRVSSTKGAANDCSVPIPPVKINEVESSGGTPVDWIELRNNGVAPVDVSGFRLKDNDDSRTFAIAAGTTIPAGGLLAVDVDVAGGFGLGSADSARVFLPDGTTLVDSYTWAAHAAVTYGRCPDGTGAFGERPTATKGTANDCPPTGYAALRVNEVEGNGDPVGDWVELVNVGATTVDLSGLRFKDNDDTRTYAIPAGTTLAPGAFHVLNEAEFGFGIGAADAARLFEPDGTTLIDSHTWTEHAVTSYGRCPDGTGAFVTTGVPTKGTANDCAPLLRINEIESDGGVPGDWVELYNYGSSAIDLSGLVLKDSVDANAYPIPAGTTIPAGGYAVLEQAGFGFELDGDDSVRLFAGDGTTLYDSYAWTAHAVATTYGRCPNGTGAFATTQVVTKGAVNNCPGDLVTQPWPGSPAVSTVDVAGQLGGDVSGLTYDPSGTSAPGVLWAVDNGAGSLLRLVRDGTQWVPDTANGWTAAGKALKYADGTGVPDTEGVSVGGPTSAAGIYTATERNNQANGVSRIAVLRYDVTGPGSTLTATDEWTLTFPGVTLSPNTGIETIAWVPDSYLVASGFKGPGGTAYDPAAYPDHGDGLFLVGLEANGRVYAYALDHTSGTSTLVADFASGFTGVMALDWEEETDRLWVVCDDTCTGRHAVFEVETAAGATQGTFVARTYYERPAGMPNLNNEGFTTTPRAECAGGSKPVFWSDDSQTGGHAIRSGTIPCTPRTAQTVTITSSKPASGVVGQTYAVTATGGASGNPVVLGVTPTPAGACTLDGSTVTFRHPGSCAITATQAGDDDYLPGSATPQTVTISRAATTTGTITVTPTSISATVAPVAPGAGVPTGLVRFSVDGVEVGTSALGNGVAVLDHVVPPGATRTVLASYLGSTDYAESAGTTVRKDPTVDVEISPAPNAAGWYDSPVTVTFTCTPQGSPLIGTCPAPITLDTSGAGQEVGAVVTAQNGGRAVVTTGPLDIDLDAPVVRVGGVKDGKTYKKRPSPVCVGSDATSFVTSCTVTVQKVGRRTFRAVATAVDAAGNRSTAQKTYQVRKRVKG